MRQFSIGGGSAPVEAPSPAVEPRKTTVIQISRRLLAATWAGVFGMTLLVAPPANAIEMAPVAVPVVTKTVSAEGFLHPGVGLSGDQLQTAQRQVQAGTEPWASYYKAMAETKYAARDYVAGNQGASDDTPLSDAYNQASMRSRAHTDSLGALTQALMYVMTGDEVYRANALHVLRTWSSMDPGKYQYFPDAHIHTGVPLYQFVTAAEIIRSTAPANPSLNGYDLTWTQRDQQRAKDNMVLPTMNTFLFSPNRLWNQHLYGVIGMIAGAIFIDDPKLYAERVEWFSVNSTFQPNGTINGGDVNGSLDSVLREITTGNPLNPYGHDFVELVEMGRDQAHAEGDITTLTAIARMINNQGTRLDPIHGTVSKDPASVSPYGFLGNRLLKGANSFTQFMMGDEVPFIDVSGGSSTLSQAYRGRLRDMMSELYYQYKYVEGVDVEKEAPSIAELHENSDGPLYYYGSGVENFWNPRGSDFTGSEYWAAFPSALAGQAVTVPSLTASAELPTTRYGHPLSKDAKQIDDDGQQFVRLQSQKDNPAVAIRRMVWSDTSKTSLVGIKVRSKGGAVLRASRTATSVPFADVSIPDTHDQWTYVWLDLDANKTPASKVGENILFLSAVGSTPQVDVAGILSQANGVLTPPVFKDAPRLGLVAVAGEQFSRKIDVANSDGQLTLALQGAPKAAAINADGVLAWSPAQGEPAANFIVVGSDGQSTTTLPVTVAVAPDRRSAISKLLEGVRSAEQYTSKTWLALQSTQQAALDGVQGADAATFGTLLENLRVAVSALEELNPRLEDGSLDFPKVVTSPQVSASTLGALTDGSNQTTWGDQRVPSVVLDAGPAYRLRIDKFGFLARDTFPDRARGTVVYGSNDNATWTLLTEHPAAGRDDALEYVNVKEGVREQRFRFLKLQIEGDQTASVWTLADFRISGDRSQTVGSLDTVAVSSTDAVAGRVVAGDEAQVRFTADSRNTNITVSILGQPATVTLESPGAWVARRTLQDGEGVGSPLSFVINFTTPDGRAADAVEASTDGSSLYVSTNSGLVDGAFAAARVTNPTLEPSSTYASDAAKLFDNNAGSYTDTRLSNGVYALTWDFGAGGAAQINSSELLVRQDGYGISRIKDLRLEGSNDGLTWVRLTTTPPQGTLAWQKWAVSDNSSYRYVRLINGDIMGVAELRLYGTHQLPAEAVTQATISSSGPTANYAVPGNTVTVDVTTNEEVTSLTAVVTGVAENPVTAAFTPVDGNPLHQRASVPVTAPRTGSDAAFEITYATKSGIRGRPVTATTDGSAVRLGTNDSYLGDIVTGARMVTPTGQDDTSTVSRPHNLFDMNLSTYTDARVVNGSADIVWDFGTASVSVNRAEMALRQDSYGLTRIKGMKLMGSNDLTTWTPIAGVPQSTLRWQDLPTQEGAQKPFRYLRLTNGTILNVAELRLYGSKQ